MILRRCRFIVASDAGQDEGHNFEDLGGLVRKVRTDLGIPIEFDDKIRILPRTAAGPGLLCAIGTIHYECVDGKVDGKDVQPGLLLYLKPTLLAEGLPLPADVLSYSRASETFPHEPTSDQWFTEAQFESYRSLGYHMARQLGGGGRFEDIPALFEAVGHSLEEAKGSGRTREEEIQEGR